MHEANAGIVRIVMAEEPQETAAAPGPDQPQEFRHEPVMLEEVAALVAPVPSGVFVDATLGGGGHSERILAENPRLEVLGIDRDPMALEAAARRLGRFGIRVRLHRETLPRIYF